MSRQKKYKMTAISSKFSEKGGYRAQFVAEGYSIDARKEILPDAIKETGIQVGEGAAWDLIQRFLKNCSSRAATTGETVTVGSLLSFGLTIKGWFANKGSKASKDNVRVSAKLLDDLKPTVAFSMSNENDGVTLTLYTVASEGGGLGHVRPAAAFRINGRHLQLLEGDRVTASMKNAAGETVEAECTVTDSAVDHIDATLPGTFCGEGFAGREITITVEGRCGDPNAGTQVKSIDATLDAAVPPYITSVTCAGHEDDPDRLFDGCSVTIHGVGLADAGTAMFEFTDKAGAGHEFTLGDEMLVEKSDTAYLIDSSLVVESMRTICLEEGSELDTAAGATAVLPFPDGKQASRHVAFG